MSLDDWRSRAVDHAPHDVRSDVLRYVSEPLKDDVLVIGEPELILWAASSARDTDFVVRLIELRFDGTAVGLSRAIVRARYRQGYGREVLLEPGKPERFLMELSPIGVLLQSGTRLRLDITSSDFPNFDRNHNTGRPFWADSDLVTATQTVFHDDSRRSCLSLPLSGDRHKISRARQAMSL
jgi:putative CocE/NonD family hydrolase